MSVTHTAKMDGKSWAIYGVLLGLVVPPAFYGVFSVLDIGFLYKWLIWLGVVMFLAVLLRWYPFQMFLRWIGEQATGKHTQS